MTALSRSGYRFLAGLQGSLFETARNRQAQGGFAAVEDLATRGLLPASLVHTLRDVLIAVR